MPGKRQKKSGPPERSNPHPLPHVHLLCNAHLDPVWQWEWEEGAAAALATFRVAAKLCESFPYFVFNHNEAILYRWVEEFDPDLFRRIRRLVKAGRWRIIGGWHLQPDCNMPSGEALSRQILAGKLYFMEKFGVEPRVAINFDSFGHDRGLVQILARSGYDAYIVCRPGEHELPLPGRVFRWTGYDGSEILVCRPWGGYGSDLDQAREKLDRFLDQENLASLPAHLLLWGVGDHGGGPSRVDVERIGERIGESPKARIQHSYPEAFFEALKASGEAWPPFAGDLRPSMVGCYTSMAGLKSIYRRLEGAFFSAEKLLAYASAAGLVAYPKEDLAQAQDDMLLLQFHDALPGSGIEAVEEAMVRTAGHGLEILSRIQARAFFALARGEREAQGDAIPLLVFNPHPYPVTATIECECILSGQNWTGSFTDLTVRTGTQEIPAQLEQERSHLNLDWRKRVVFRANLGPTRLHRFEAYPRLLPARPVLTSPPVGGRFVLLTSHGLDLAIDAATGLLARFRLDGREVLREEACLPVVMQDDADPWGMRVQGFPTLAGAFRPMDPRQAASFAGVSAPELPPVRIIEDGPVRMVVEALLAFGASSIRLRYFLPKAGRELLIEARVHWAETGRMLKLQLPLPLGLPGQWKYLGEGAFGVSALAMDGSEMVAHRWVAAVNEAAGWAVTCLNSGCYGSDATPERLRLSLLRAPAYCAHPIQDRPLVPQDRHTPRMDQGVRTFRFVLGAGPVQARLDQVGREGEVFSEPPMALSFFPSGPDTQEPVGEGLSISDPVIQLAACKKAEDGKRYILRLFEPTGWERRTRLKWPAVHLDRTLRLNGFQLLTLALDPEKGTLEECDLLERPAKGRP